MFKKIKILFLIIFVLSFCLTTEVLSVLDVKYHGSQYRDPLKSLLPRVAPAPGKPLKMNVQGLIWNTDRPSAIINGQVLNIGDSIDSAKIINITKEGVLIIFSGEKFLIRTGNVKK